MKRLLAKIRWMLFWGFILCLIMGPFIGWHTEATAIGAVACHAASLIGTIFNGLVGGHGLTVKTH